MAGVVVVLAGVLVLSRALLAPEFLYFFDSVNFALALDDFNPALHQPQPPGYPLFVLLAKVVFGFVRNPQQALVISGILASATTMALVWRLGRDMFGARAGFFATLLLLAHPTFWFGGLTNQVRVFLALAGAAVLLAAWRPVREQSPWCFYATAACIGVMSGFRPDVLFFATPLLLYAGVRSRRTMPQWIIAAAVLGVTVGAWVLFVSRAVNGIEALLGLVRAYSDDQFKGTSLVFGAGSQPALRMFEKALIWYGIPVVPWLIFTPFARGFLLPLRSAAGLLLASVLPAFLFHSVIHVGDPDHTLFAVPALCLTGGLVVSCIRWSPVVLAGVVALNVAAFFAPPRGIAEACSYRSVRAADIVTRETFRAIEEMKKSGPVTIVALDHWVSWRHLYYYYRDVPLLILRQDPRRHPDPKSAWLIYNRQVQEPELVNGEIELPSGRIIWLLSHGLGMHKLLAQSVELVQPSFFIAYTDLQPGAKFHFGEYRFSQSSRHPTPLLTGR